MSAESFINSLNELYNKINDAALQNQISQIIDDAGNMQGIHPPYVFNFRHLSTMINTWKTMFAAEDDIDQL